MAIYAESIILPEVNLVSIWVLKRDQLAILHSLNLASMSPLRLQIFNGLTDVVNFEAKTRVAASRHVPLISTGNEFEQNAVNVESGDKIPRSQPQAEYIRIERDRSFHIRDIIEDAIEVEPRHDLNLPYSPIGCSPEFETLVLCVRYPQCGR